MSRNFVLLLSALVLWSCQKSAESLNEPPPSPSTTNTDKAKLIFVCKTDHIQPPFSLMSVTAFKPDGTVQWKRTDIKYPQGSLVYNDGLLFLYSGNSYCAVDVNTGADVWKKPNLGFGPIENNIMYTEYYDTTGYYIRAYDIKTGSVLWSKVCQDPPVSLVKGGNTLYYISFPPNVNLGKLTALDISTQTVKWTASIGSNIFTTPSRIVVGDEHVYISTGTYKLTAFDKNTGVVSWSNNTAAFRWPVTCKNLLLSTVKIGGDIYAFNQSTGQQMWMISKNFLSQQPFVVDNKIYISGSDTDGFIECLDAASGNSLWKKTVYFDPYAGFPIGNLIVTGGLIYGFRLTSDPALHPVSWIMIHDGNNGSPKDSFAVTGANYEPIRILTTSGKFIQANTF